MLPRTGTTGARCFSLSIHEKGEPLFLPSLDKGASVMLVKLFGMTMFGFE